ncbi:MAG: tRNA dihydrouridine synthase DusB [Bacteroidales bacterium]|nr:tRNA dihydrouridine synthase DusB [Bacteroidales bacterium]
MKIGTVELPDFPVMLAPMEDITDPPFRLLCKRQGADVVFTEFIASEGLIREVAKSRKKLELSDTERPAAIQLFGNNVEAMVMAARMAEEAGPDFIDLNFGCPVRKIVNKGGGAALLQNVPLMLEITRSVARAVKVPVTVKTRLGWDEKSRIIVELAPRLQDCGIAALTIHGRTRAQLYGGKADWTLIGEVKNTPGIHIPIIGNGDVTDGPSALIMKQSTGVDGIMIGRAAVGNPWIFSQVKQYLATGEHLPLPGVAERVSVCREHLQLSAQWKGEITAVLETRRHYARYFSGLSDFKPFRINLLAAVSADQVFRILEEIEESYKL